MTERAGTEYDTTAASRYETVRERLAPAGTAGSTDTAGTVSVATLPDGSVDTYCRVVAGGGGALPTRAALAERVASGSKSIHLVRDHREPGGQCVNMAQQAHALGDDTTCYGFLDDSILTELPFETVSMGLPADIRVCVFADDAENVVFALDSEAVAHWTLADLVRVAEPDALAVDAVCVGNWVTCRGISEALGEIGAVTAAAESPRGGGLLVVDPGDVTAADDAELEGFLDGLCEAAGACRTVLSVNDGECLALGALLGVGDDQDDALDAIHDRTGAVAALHGRERAAVVAGADDRWSVPALSLEAVERRTGAGDRWSAALAHARARAWDWPHSLAFANACAGYYVATAQTATPDRLRSFLATTGP